MSPSPEESEVRVRGVLLTVQLQSNTALGDNRGSNPVGVKPLLQRRGSQPFDDVCMIT